MLLSGGMCFELVLGAASAEQEARLPLHHVPVMATWFIRSRTGTVRRRKKCYPCLQTQEGGCRIRRRQKPPHARTTIRSCNGEASCMGRVFTTLQRLLDDCLHGLSSRLIHWT